MNTNHSPDVIPPAAAKRSALGNRALAAALLAGSFALAGLGVASGIAHAAPRPTVDRNWCWTWDVDRSAVPACKYSDPPQA
jgi:hypothetical protein